MSELRTMIFHRVLHRPNLILGCDREAIMFSLVMFGGISLISMNIVVALVCGVLQVGVLSLLREMAKFDPKLVPIYFRQVKYQNYYMARSTPFRKG